MAALHLWCASNSLRRRGGARLTHSHERQYNYVLQSLTLWREISHEVGRVGASMPGLQSVLLISATQRDSMRRLI